MHTLALSVEGVVYSFGCNDEGALGRAIEDDEEGFTPGEVKIDEKIVQVKEAIQQSTLFNFPLFKVQLTSQMDFKPK